MRKNKNFRKAMSLLLTLAILVGTLAIAIPQLKVNVGAITTSDGETITQTQIVTDNREVTYGNYAAQYLNGAGESTGIVIPGLDPSQDYVIQGMTYYPQKDWMLVTAYHNAGTKSSKAFCMDAKTGEFVAVLSFLNVDGSVNMDHGGGIAISEHNLYYSCGDMDRSIAYAPLSALDGIQKGEHRVVQLAGEVEFTEIGSVTKSSKTAYTAYVCYDQGYLWMGNFYDNGADLLGIDIAATDYNAPATSDFNSMVYGYKLKGSSSAAEWGNLISGISDCKGSPTHAIALENNIKDVQYAVVDNGKLYLSCSFGTGAGNSVSFGFGETSKLITADIDLSAQPTTEVQISTSSDNSSLKTIKAHKIDTYKTYEMMPMSEGLCIVNDLIFCTFESASNKYKNDAGLSGNCTKPVDVIWKIDPYALENEVRVEDPPYSYYEKVNSLDEIENGEEYLIVYESPEKDPVTQQNILYAIDANGGYKDYRLSKNSHGDNVGYVGAIGHPITEYSIEDGKLYLDNAEKDDARNLRWKVSDLGNNSYSIQSPDYYFVNQPNFYFDAANISMTTDLIRGNNIKIQESNNGEGGFWISNGDSFLWCNDGTTASYNTAYNNYYNANNEKVAMYSDVTEQAGTFHTNALNSDILGGSIITGSDTYYAHGLFYMYRRVVDRASSTFESRVYTDMKASLQADGTYTIDLETYAISSNHYMPVDDRPTDYIIVMDKSQSVSYTKEEKDCDGNVTGYSGATLDGTGLTVWPAENYLSIKSLCNESDTELPASKKASVNGYAFSKPNEQIYIQHAADGMYYKVYLAVYTTKVGTSLGTTRPEQQYYWAYYIADDGLYYVLVSETDAQNEGHSTSFIRDGLTREQFYKDIENAANGTSVAFSGYSHSTSNGSRQDIKIYRGAHATYTCGEHSMNETSRITTIKEKAKQLVDEIAEQGSDNRIAITYYGDASYYLNKEDSAWATSGFKNAFWPATDRDTLKNYIDGISNFSGTKQADTSGMEMYAASNIMQYSDAGYKSDGTKNCVIIFISDGVPGEDGASNPTNAANNVIAKARTLKENGAFIFTTIVGEDPTSFDKNKYMEAVSSKYPAANSMAMSDGAYTDLGGASVDGVIYTSNLGDTSYEKFAKYADINGREFVKNEAVAIANLDVNSILNEELTSAFKPIIDEDGSLADGIEITHQLVPGYYDMVERFSFDESAAYVDGNIKLSYDESNSRKITITGYDYGEKYISKEKTGYKLKVRITGVQADEAADITNTSINNTATTAIYQTDNSGAFKYFPTEYFNIPTYTYVLDYDLPMYDSDINGTLCSVDAGLNKQSTYKTVRETENVALNFVNGNQDMTYELMSGEYSDQDNRSFCLIQRDNGTYDWFRINIVPASNVLYEEGRFEKSTAGSLTKSNWVTDGTPKETYQTLSTDNDRYGYDENYANNGAGYSNGTALKATVNSTTKRSETMTFSYTGTGFDLMAVCGANTGVQLVNVKKADGSIEKVYMVDTYYVDTANYDGALLKQVPIVNHTNKDGYGDYTVEVTAAYLANAQAVTGGRTGLFNKTYTANDLLKDMGINTATTDVEYVWFNDNSVLNGGTGAVAKGNSNRADSASGVELECYIDGIRVYNPLGDDNSLYVDSEKGAEYYNVVTELAKTEGGVITSEGSLFAYVVGSLAADDEGNIPTLSFGNYQSVGPQNEIYLQSATGNDDSHAVAFNVTVPNADSRVMVSLRAVDGAATAKVASGSKSIEFAINTATEQYFDITPYLDIDTSTGKANVVITNSGSTGLLSVNNIKLVDATASVVEGAELNQMAMSLALTPTVVEPNTYDYDAIVSEGVKPGDIPGGNNPSVDEPEVDEPVVDEPVVDDPVVDEPTDDNTDNGSTVENIFTRIINFFKNFFKTFFGK